MGQQQPEQQWTDSAVSQLPPDRLQRSRRTLRVEGGGL